MRTLCLIIFFFYSIVSLAQVYNSCEEAIVNLPLCEAADIETFSHGYFNNDLRFTGSNCNYESYIDGFSLWTTFIAGFGDYDLEVVSSGCPGPSGEGAREGVIFEYDANTCFGETIECNASFVQPDFVLNCANLIPGKRYILGLSYWQGFTTIPCISDLNIIGNFVNYSITSPRTYRFNDEIVIQNPLLVCNNDINTYSIFSDDGFAYENEYELVEHLQFRWQIKDENSILLEELFTQDNDLDYQFSTPGTYYLCIDEVFSDYCNLSNDDELCLTVISKPYADEDFGQVSVCSNEIEEYIGPTSVNNDPMLPSDPNGDGVEGWHASLDFTFGQNESQVTTPPCLHLQSVYINEIFDSEYGIIDTAVCGHDAFPLTILDQEISSEIELFNWRSVDLAQNGCDSLYSLFLYNFEIEGDIAVQSCDTRGYILEFIPSNISNTLAIPLQYEWKDQTGNILNVGQDSSNVLVTDFGKYFLSISFENYFEHTDQTVTCPYQFEFDLNDDSFTQAAPMPVDWLPHICERTNEAIFIAEAESVDSNLQFYWTYNIGLERVDSIDNDTLILDYSGFMDTISYVCVSYSDVCGISDEYCDSLDVRPNPSSLFTSPESACLDSTIVLKRLGEYDSLLQVIWDVYPAIVVKQDTINQTLELYWDNEGDKIVALQVIEDGCTSQSLDTILVSKPLSPPIINCVSSADEVIFSWASDSSHLSYTPNSNFVGTLLDTTYVVSDLAVGSVVTLDLVVETNSPCGDVVSTATCSAQNCPPIIVTGTNPSQVCLDVLPINLNYETNQTVNGNVVWSGVGVINNTFDPALAGVGIHHILVQITDADNCVYQGVQQIEVLNTPLADFALSSNPICIDNEVILTYTGTSSPDANYQWTVEDVFTLPVGQGPHNLKWSFAGIKDLSLIVEELGCLSDKYDITLEVDHRIGPIDVNCTATPEQINIQWALLDNVTNFTLYDNGEVIGSNLSTGSFIYSNLVQDSIYDFKLVAHSDNSCEGDSILYTCMTGNCPIYDITFNTNDTVVCNAAGNKIQLEAYINNLFGSTNFNSEWIGPGVDISTGLFDPTVAGLSGPEGHKIIFRFSEGPCADSASIRIKVIDNLTATFFAPNPVCVGEEAIIEYTGNVPDFDLIWNIEGVNQFEQISELQYKVVWEESGIYEVSLNISHPGCLPSSYSEEIIVENEIAPLNPTCNGTDSTILFSWNDIECAKDYYIYLDGELLITQEDTSLLFENLVQGDTLYLQIVPITECVCPLPNGTITCKVADCPPITLNARSNDNIFCLNQVNAMELEVDVENSDGSGIGYWIGDGLDSMGNYIGKVLPGQYKYYYIHEEGQCTFIDSIELQFVDTPSIIFEVIDPPCYDDELGFIEVDENGIEADYILTIDSDTITSKSIQKSIGKHTISVIDSNGCNTQYHLEIFENQDYLLVSGASEQVIGADNHLILDINFENVDSVVWTRLSDGKKIECALDCNNILIKPDKNETYCATVYYDGKCSINECFDVLVVDQILTLPNVMNTQSSVNRNKVFFVPSYSSIKRIISMEIFSPSGSLVFSKDNFFPGPEFGWDGKLNGVEVSAGVYIYHIKLRMINDEVKTYTGEILKL